MQSLLHSSAYHYILFAETYDVTGAGIKTWVPDEPARFFQIPTKRFGRRFYAQRGLVRLALRKDIDAIIYTGDAQYLTTWLSAGLARLTGKRVLFWTHGWLRDEHGPKAWIRRTFYHLAHGLLLYGERARSIGARHGFDSNQLYAIFNSLDYEQQKQFREKVTLEQIQATRQRLFEYPQRPVVIFVGRLIPSKRVDLLLAALSELAQLGHLVNAIIVGDGPERERLEQICIQQGLSAKFMGGSYDEASLSVLLMSANVTVSPGNAGLLVMHSLAYGTPVITHDDLDRQMPETEAITPGINGALFRYNDCHDLARTILAWTQHVLPSEQIRAQCYGIIEQYYNPEYQKFVIERAISGQAAGDA